MLKYSNEYGYPSCCIHWFYNRMHNKIGTDLTYLQEKYCKHGFIPCPSCAEKLETEKMKLHQLIIEEKRTVDTPFPISNPRNDKQIQEVIEKRNKYKKSNETEPTLTKRKVNTEQIILDFS